MDVEDILQILTTSLIHFSLKGWENVLLYNRVDVEDLLQILTTSLIHFSLKGWENVLLYNRVDVEDSCTHSLGNLAQTVQPKRQVHFVDLFNVAEQFGDLDLAK